MCCNMEPQTTLFANGIRSRDREGLPAIPELPEARALEWGDAGWLRALLKEHPPVTSEMTFTNLLAWSDTHPVLVGRIGETVLLWRGAGEGGALLAPLGDLDAKGVSRAFAWSGSHGGRPAFFRVSQGQANRLIDADSSLASFADRDHADYVYRVDALAGLEGRAYEKKRNQIKKFEKETNARYVALDAEWAKRCLGVQALWCDENECASNPDLAAEDRAVRSMLNGWERFGLFGGALVEDDRVLAFCVAERLNGDTAVIHVEKADRSVPGAYQAINQRFSAEALGGFTYVNREQDLGVDGLRRAKMSYHPDHLVEKYAVTRRDTDGIR